MQKDLNKMFQPFLKNQTFQEVLHIVKQNSKGKIWVIGGFVYKNLASALYGTMPYEYDIDFIVEHKNKELKEVTGWNIYTNSYSNQNYIRERNNMSFTDIHEVIRVNGFRSATIEDFILDTPLNIQSIAYDIEDGILIGEMGIKALEEKVVKINNLAQAKFYVQKKNKTLDELLIEKGKELNFEIER